MTLNKDVESAIFLWLVSVSVTCDDSSCIHNHKCRFGKWGWIWKVKRHLSTCTTTKDTTLVYYSELRIVKFYKVAGRGRLYLSTNLAVVQKLWLGPSEHRCTEFHPPRHWRFFGYCPSTDPQTSCRRWGRLLGRSSTWWWLPVSCRPDRARHHHWGTTTSPPDATDRLERSGLILPTSFRS